MSELKSCPFCGGEAQYRKATDQIGNLVASTWKVECSNCWASPLPNNYEGDKRVAAARWNRRANDGD